MIKKSLIKLISFLIIKNQNKIRVKIPKEVNIDEEITIKILIKHPNESGTRKDKNGNIVPKKDKDGNTVPKNIINNLKIKIDKKKILDIFLNIGISKYPFFELSFIATKELFKQNSEHKISIIAKDDENNIFEKEQIIKVLFSNKNSSNFKNTLERKQLTNESQAIQCMDEWDRSFELIKFTEISNKFYNKEEFPINNENITISMPKIVENGAVTPISVDFKEKNIKSLYMLSENTRITNPEVYLTCKIHQELNLKKLGTRIRMNKSGDTTLIIRNKKDKYYRNTNYSEVSLGHGC